MQSLAVLIPHIRSRQSSQAWHVSGREKGARYELMTGPGKKRAPGTHMTDIYRRHGRSAHCSSRTGADVDHVQFLFAAAPFIAGVGDPCRFLAFLTTTIATAILKTPLDSGTHPLSIPRGPGPDSGAGAEPTPAHGSGRLGGRLGARSQIHAAPARLFFFKRLGRSPRVTH